MDFPQIAPRRLQNGPNPLKLHFFAFFCWSERLAKYAFFIVFVLFVLAGFTKFFFSFLSSEAEQDEQTISMKIIEEEIDELD